MNILKAPMGRPITLLAFIGIADMLFTAVGLEAGWFGEANPILNHAWQAEGILGFMAVKSTFILATTFIFTACRVKKEEVADRYARVACWLYVIIFGLGILAQI